MNETTMIFARKIPTYLPILILVLSACDTNTGAGTESPAKSTTGVSIASSPACELGVAEDVHKGGLIIVELSINNPTSENIEVLQYFTPLEGILGEVFTVEFQGEPLDYLGPMVKRKPPTEEDWLPINANETLTAKIDISPYWDMSEAGEYTLNLTSDFSYRSESQEEPATLAAAECDSVQFSIN